MTDAATDVAQFSQASILDFLDEYLVADDAVAAAVGERKDLRKRIKGEGINLNAFDKARKDARMSGEEREERDRHYRRIMAFMGKPVGHQGMFDLGAQTEADKAQVSVSRLKEVDNEGYAAGMRGDRADRNSWSPGSEEFARWQNSWTRGQSEKVAKEIKPTEGRRGPGRPRKAANGASAPGLVAEPNAEARALGEADGRAGTTEHADQFPAGAEGHADYELGRAAAQPA